MSKGRRTAVGVVLSIAFVLLAPLCVVGGLFVDHLASFDGTCGPYAPDIPAHPCDMSTYAENFFGGFAGMGLIIVGMVSCVVAFGLTAFGWVVWALVVAVRNKPTEAGGRG